MSLWAFPINLRYLDSLNCVRRHEECQYQDQSLISQWATRSVLLPTVTPSLYPDFTIQEQYLLSHAMRLSDAFGNSETESFGILLLKEYVSLSISCSAGHRNFCVDYRLPRLQSVG